MKKLKKKKIRIPLPKQVSKVQDTDKKKYNRKYYVFYFGLKQIFTNEKKGVRILKKV